MAAAAALAPPPAPPLVAPPLPTSRGASATTSRCGGGEVRCAMSQLLQRPVQWRRLPAPARLHIEPVLGPARPQAWAVA